MFLGKILHSKVEVHVTDLLIAERLFGKYTSGFCKVMQRSTLAQVRRPETCKNHCRASIISELVNFTGPTGPVRNLSNIMIYRRKRASFGAII